MMNGDVLTVSPSHRYVRNVIIVSDAASNTGGASQMACLTARILNERGYNVVYFAGVGPVREELSSIRTIVVRDKPFLESDSKIKGAFAGLHSKRTYDALHQLLEEFSPSDTIVHIHEWTHSLSSSIFDAIADCGFRCVVTLHEYFLVCPNGGLYDYQRNQICRIKPCSVTCVLRNCDKRNYAQKLYRVARIMRQNKSVARANPRFCYLSPFTYNIMRGNRFDDGNPTFLPNPTTTADEPTQWSFPNSANRHGYLFVGRLDIEKNPKLFCEALTRLGLPGTICGAGPLLEPLKREYSNIRFLGWCDKEELRKQYLQNRAYVLTSSCPETFGLTGLEAMFVAGMPSVIPETAGTTVYVKNGVNGVWFKNNDLDSLCQAIRRIENESFYTRLLHNIRQSLPESKTEYSCETYAKRLGRIYEGTMQNDVDSESLRSLPVRSSAAEQGR